MSQINISGVKYNKRVVKEDLGAGRKLSVTGDGKVDEPFAAAVQDSMDQGIDSFEDNRLRDLSRQLHTMRNSPGGIGLGQNSPEIEQYVAKDTLGDEWKALGNGQFSHGSLENHQILSVTDNEVSLTTRASINLSLIHI